MNRSDAKGVKVEGGYQGQYRRVWKAYYEPVQGLDERGQFTGPKIFNTQDAAEAAAWRVLRDLEQPVMTRSGPMLTAVREKAEALFRGKDKTDG